MAEAADRGALDRHPLTRRMLLQRGGQAVGALGIALFGGGVAVPVARAAGGADGFGALQPADANGLMLPRGFSSRVVAVTGQAVGATGYPWHGAPDGGATFVTADGGWIYVSNSELNGGAGGAGAIRFAQDGSIAAAYPILSGTSRNCAGGPTPWGTWLSCEEVNGGRVYECDPYRRGANAVLRSSLGTYNHEAAAVDPFRGRIYLTEDKSDGLLYRFTPDAYPDLGAGTLEAAQVLDPGGRGEIVPGQVRALAWHPVSEPNPAGGGVQSPNHQPLAARATRYQVAAASSFNGGEGCWHEGGVIYFSTKGDNRVWKLDTAADELSILYDLASSATSELTNVDNVFAAASGDVYVAEDPGNLQIVALTPSGGVKPIVQVTGQSGTEITGPALSPDGKRLYFSSQRNPGTTYEVSGPFLATGLPTANAPVRGLLVASLAGAAALRWRALRARRQSA